MTALTFEPSAPPVRAWTARLARVGVPSQEGRPRLFTTTTRLYLATATVAPLTDPAGHPLGTVKYVTATDQWVYAFGFVHDADTMRDMHRRILIPQFALTHARMNPPQPDEPRLILEARIRAVRAVPNPAIRPAGTVLWTGLRFTVEDNPS